MHRLIGTLALSAILAACQSNTHPVVSPLPTPTPHTSPTAAILQSADIPAGLTPCLGSGPIDVYTTTLAQADAALATRVGTQWDQLRIAGATAGFLIWIRHTRRWDTLRLELAGPPSAQATCRRVSSRPEALCTGASSDGGH